MSREPTRQSRRRKGVATRSRSRSLRARECLASCTRRCSIVVSVSESRNGERNGHVGEIPGGSNHSERSDELTRQNERKPYVSSAPVPTLSERSKQTEKDQGAGMLQDPILLWEIGLLQHMLHDPQRMSIMVRLAIIQQERCRTPTRQLEFPNLINLERRRRTGDGELRGVPHARDDKLHQMERSPAREVRAEHWRTERCAQAGRGEGSRGERYAPEEVRRGEEGEDERESEGPQTAEQETDHRDVVRRVYRSSAQHGRGRDVPAKDVSGYCTLTNASPS